MKRTSTFLAVARKYGLLLSILAVPLFIAAENGFPTWEDYNADAGSIAGIWISSQQGSPEDNVWIWTETLTPLDNSGTRYAYRGSGANGTVHEGMLGLSGVRVPGVALGEFVKTGENEYYFTVICHAAGAIPEENLHAQLKWVWYWIGTASLSKDGTLVKDGMWQFYNSIDVSVDDTAPAIVDKDVDDDGFPDEGAVPLLCGPWPMESKRVQLQPQAVKEDADFYY
ncbi:MAG TPA: hypothetical protein VMX36_02385 [Sedimentisphaerales bacterium]|nr:hypothetical protein [Sedimentisphaerales bacterium]